MRKLGLVALVALLTLVPVSAATAKTKVEAFAAKHHLKGTWKSKDSDRDGLKNLKEFKLGTDPRKADTDKDGLKDGHEIASGNHPRKADTDGDGTKDGAEHAGTVTAFDGATITVREFATGKTFSAALDTECTPATTDEDEAFSDEAEDEGAEFFQEEDEDFDADTSGCTDDEGLEPGLVLQSAELEGGFLVDYVIKG
jgi:hypothetical protein